MTDVLKGGPGSFPRTAEHRELARKVSLMKFRSDCITLWMELGYSREAAAQFTDDLMESHPGRLLPDPETPTPAEDL